MANILLKAILDTSDITKQISTLHKDLTKGSNLKEGLQLFSKGSIEKSLNDLKLMRHHLRSMENEASVLKRTGLFGDTKSLKSKFRDFNRMFGDETTSNLSKFKKRTDEINSTLRILEKRALFNKSENFRSVWEQQGSAGLLTRATSDSKKFAEFRTPGAAKTINQLVDLEPQLTAMRNMTEELGHIDAKAVKLSKSLKDSFNPLINFFNNLGVAGNSLFSIFGTLVAKVGTWLVATSMLYGTMKVVTSVMSEMKALQDAEYNLRRVIGGTNEEIEDRIKLSFSFAKSMNILAGSSYKDTIIALENVTKAGFKFAESLYITRAALLGVNVAELTADESSRYLIATIRQFNLDASDSLWIMNQWNELGQTTGATTREIAEAVIRSGKAFQAVGGSLNQLNAIAAATIEATGESGEKIGTMLKTVSARYADLSTKKSLEKMLAVPNLKIDIYDENKDEFNNIFEVLQKLSMKWETLGEAQRAEIGKVAAGVRQWSRFLGIVENFDGVMNGLISSFESNDSLLTENAKRVNSLDFALRRLGGAMSGLAKSKGSAVLLKITTDAMYGLTGIINMIVSPIGILVLSLYGMYRGLMFVNAQLSITKGLALATSLQMNTLAKAMVVFRLITNVINPYIAGIMLAAGALIFMSGAAEKARHKVEEFRSTMMETVKASLNTNTEFQKNIDTLVNYYNTLDKTTESSKTTADRLDALFNEKLGVTLTSVFETASREGTKFNTVLDNLKASAAKLTLLKNVINDISAAMRKANKNRLATSWSKDSGEREINILDTQLKMALGNKDITKAYTNVKNLVSITERFFGKGFTINPESFKNAITLFDKYKEIENLQVSGGGMGDTFNKLNDFVKKNEITISTKIDAPDRIDEFEKLIKKEYGITIDFQDPNTPDLFPKFLQYLVDTQQISQEEFNKKIEDDKDEANQRMAEKYENMFKLIESYYDLEYEKAKATYDKIKDLNDSMVSSFNEGLLDLSEGVTFGQRIENAFSGVGDTLFSTLVGDINKQISDALTGDAPKSMAQLLKDAVEIGGESAKLSILLGFQSSVGTLDEAFTVWQNRLAYAVQGKSSEDLTQAGINLAIPGKTVSDTKIKELIAAYEMKIKGLSGNGNNRVLQGTEDISKWLKETFFGKGDTKGLFSGFGTLGTDAFGGAGLGAYVAGMAGKDSTSGGIGGAIGGALGGLAFGPTGMILGGLVGGLFAKDKEDEAKAEEQIDYAKQSTTELQKINRNTSAMVEELKNFSVMQDSYYFSFSNAANRGLAR